jgi:hypothetical protein
MGLGYWFFKYVNYIFKEMNLKKKGFFTTTM